MRNLALLLVSLYIAMVSACAPANYLYGERLKTCDGRDVNCQVSVTIDVEWPENWWTHGSGVVISTDGFIITDAHVIGEVLDNNIMVRYEVDGQTKRELAVLAAIDYQLDLALLWVPKHFSQAALLGSSIGWEPGVALRAISTPEGKFPYTLTMLRYRNEGVFWSGYDNVIPKLKFRADSEGIAPGSSGGGVFDANGHLVGLIQRIGIVERKIVYAIPVETIRGFIETTRSCSPEPNMCLPQ